jgi:hypothetical protein
VKLHIRDVRNYSPIGLTNNNQDGFLKKNKQKRSRHHFT